MTLLLLIQLKLVMAILVVYNRILVQAEQEDKKENFTFHFLDVIKQNEKYPPQPNKCSLRIYGGVKAEHGDVPYQVALRRSRYQGRVWEVFCGGSIVTELHVVTAAHCFDNANLDKTRVIAGTIRSNVYFLGTSSARTTLLKDLQLEESWRVIDECYSHEHYSKTKICHDLAVLVLERELTFSEKIKPIPMLNQDTAIRVDNVCTASGYGLMEMSRPSPYLRMVCVPVVSFERCQRIYPNFLYSSRTQICAGSYMKDSCQGDSGGPMACKGRLVGLVSFGGRCGEAPGVYTLISGYTTGDHVPFVKCVSSIFKVNSVVIQIGVILSLV